MERIAAVRAFHSAERHLFERLLDMGKSPIDAKKILSIFLWLENIGCDLFLQKIHPKSNEELEPILDEALACFQYIEDENMKPNRNRLTNQEFNLRYVDKNPDVAYKELNVILNNICAEITDDIIEKRAAEAVNQMVRDLALQERALATAGMGPSACLNPLMGPLSLADSPPLLVPVQLVPVDWDPHMLGHTGLNPLAGPVLSSVLRPPLSTPATLQLVPVVNKSGTQTTLPLNPSAKPWRPRPKAIPEEERCMFCTFSRGYPLTREEIIDFFRTKVGDCVENVYVEIGSPKSVPLFARVIFDSPATIYSLLNGEKKMKWEVKGKTLWGRIFKARGSARGTGGSGSSNV